MFGVSPMSKKDLFESQRSEMVRSSENPGQYKDGSPVYWKSQDALHRNDEVKKWAEQEFPNGLAPESFGDVQRDGQSAPAGFGRRDAMKLLGASLGLAGVTACVRRPEEAIMPYTKQPEHIVPGVAAYYATTFFDGTTNISVLAESHEGRPTKLEGNADHDSSQGKLGMHGQASVLDLYDPARIQEVSIKGEAISRGAFEREFEKLQDKLGDGDGLAFVLERIGGPSQWRALDAIKKRYPKATFFFDEGLTAVNTNTALTKSGIKNGRAHYNFKAADVVVAFDSDFLVSGENHVQYAADFASRRNAAGLSGAKSVTNMNRLYAIESIFSPTGATADNRHRVNIAQMPGFIRSLGAALGVAGFSASAFKDDAFLKGLAKDIQAHKGKSVLVAGERLSPEVQAMIFAINQSIGAPVEYTSPAALPSAYALSKSRLLELAKSAGISIPAATTFATEGDFVVWLSDALSSDETTRKERGQAASSHWSMQFRRGEGGTYQGLSDLKSALDKGSVKTLVSLGGNPVFSGTYLGLKESWTKAKSIIRVADYRDESAENAAWLLPLSHALESWNDAVSFDGDVLIQQPLVNPIFDSFGLLEVLLKFAGKTVSEREWVYDTFSAAGFVKSAADFRKVLHAGSYSQVSFERNRSLDVGAARSFGLAAKDGEQPSTSNIELVLTPDTKLKDGRWAKNGWLLELPDPMTKLSWDNALLMGASTANALGVQSGVYKNSYQAEIVKVSNEQGSVEAPVFVLPGIAPNTVHATIGWGREAFSFNGDVFGTDFSTLRDKDGSWTSAVRIEPTGRHQELASTQDHFTIENKSPIQEMKILNENFNEKRPLAMIGTSAKYGQDAEFAKSGSLRVISGGGLVEKDFAKENPAKPDRPLQMTKEVFDYSVGQQWGMTIDLTACTGCNACVIACQAENNIPIVGRESVLMGRELHWMRIDRYFVGDVDNPEVVSQAINCLQCENAPCEPVCPVAATVHDTEGLNSMVYNRCIGTRYCANNCPVKVRRFNYFDFSKSGNVYVDPASEERYKYLQLQRNPDVTVRYRGVMEKCTYCTQRINEAKMAAKRRGEDHNNLPDGAVTPACAQTCPSGAIVFGNINDPKSKVAQTKALDRNYEMLSELNIRPRTSYLAKIKNSNPELS